MAGGCVSTGKQSKEDPAALKSAQYFLDSEEHNKVRIKNFLGEHTKAWTEMDKINYLLHSVRDSDLVYVRNGDQFDGKKASRWLRWKMTLPQYKENPIDTADEFVNVVSVGSVKTGLPYQVRLPNGRYVNVNTILKTELKMLEDALIKRTKDEAALIVVSPVSNPIPPALASAAASIAPDVLQPSAPVSTEQPA